METLPFTHRRGPVRWIQKIILVPTFFRAEIPGVKAGTPAMPGRLIWNAMDLLPALRAKETEAIVRDILRASKQARRWIIFRHDRFLFKLPGRPYRAAIRTHPRPVGWRSLMLFQETLHTH